MLTETKKLKIILVSKKKIDLNLFDSEHHLENRLLGSGRKNFLNDLKNQKTFELDTDLIIIPNGSNSLGDSVITEACYAEIYFSDRNEEKFSQSDLNEAVRDFYQRKRNFGI